MEYILILLMFGSEPGLSTTKYPVLAMTAVRGFQEYSGCKNAGDAWKKTEREYGRDYECIPASAK